MSVTSALSPTWLGPVGSAKVRRPVAGAPKLSLALWRRVQVDDTTGEAPDPTTIRWFLRRPG